MFHPLLPRIKKFIHLENLSKNGQVIGIQIETHPLEDEL